MRKLRLYSQASVINHSLPAVIKPEPPAQVSPPICPVKDAPARSKIAQIIAVTVVLPCVPATASVFPNIFETNPKNAFLSKVGT